MHPEMNIQIAQLRAAEMTGRGRRHHELDRVRPAGGIRAYFRRRRDTHSAAERPSPTVVLLPPPREEHATSGHDQRVA